MFLYKLFDIFVEKIVKFFHSLTLPQPYFNSCLEIKQLAFYKQHTYEKYKNIQINFIDFYIPILL